MIFEINFLATRLEENDGNLEFPVNWTAACLQYLLRLFQTSRCSVLNHSCPFGRNLSLLQGVSILLAVSPQLSRSSLLPPSSMCCLSYIFSLQLSQTGDFARLSKQLTERLNGYEFAAEYESSLEHLIIGPPYKFGPYRRLLEITIGVNKIKLELFNSPFSLCGDVTKKFVK